MLLVLRVCFVVKKGYCSVCSFDNKEVCSLFLEEEEYDYDEDEEEYPEDEDY
jgi:hypothetical protein